jgi:protoporphyrin/coproporphyrin ferrochelatase
MKTGILLVNLGTPNSFTPKDVYRYLIEFLTDERVIDVPWLYRQLLVRGILVPKRFKYSALCYEKIWTEEGSPLLAYGKKVKGLLQETLGENYSVELAMRYQNPNIKTGISNLLNQHIEELIVFPLFPQYASATTGSIIQKTMECLKHQLYIPKVSFINNFADHPAFIEAFSELGRSHPLHSYDFFLFSYHGLPQRHLIKQDRHNHCMQKKDCCQSNTSINRSCYAAQCYATTQALVDSLEIPKNKFCVTFQSRLGKEPWLEPYTNETIVNLAKQNHKKILVFCPSFVCDCLETTYEIGMEYAAEFKHAGGEQLDLVRGLNDNSYWIKALKRIIIEKIYK